MNLVAAIWVVGLNFAAEARLEILLYGWCAIGAAAMVAWGIHEFRAERINLGMAGFALTIVFFFFSSVMDKLGRSASLMALGILFVGGGWYWEKLRRKLVARPGLRRCAMTLTRKGLILAAFQCLLVLSLTGKLLYDRSLARASG